MTLEDLIDVCQSLKPVRPSTLREWHKAAKPLRHLQIADINKAEVMKYRITQLAPRGPLNKTHSKHAWHPCVVYGIQQSNGN